MHQGGDLSQGKVVHDQSTDWSRRVQVIMRAGTIVMLLFVWAAAGAQERTPEFTDYRVQVSHTKSGVKVKTQSTPDASCFRTLLRQTATQGIKFAGHYAIDYWGCGTNCARIGIVNLITGRTYVSPFYVGIAGGGQHKSIKTKADSQLVLVNDPDVVREEYGDPVPAEFAPAYFRWTGRQLLPIRNGKVESREPERAFERCSGDESLAIRDHRPYGPQSLIVLTLAG